MSVYIFKNKSIAQKVTQYMQGNVNDPLYKQKSIEFEEGVVGTYYFNVRRESEMDMEEIVLGRGGFLIEYKQNDSKVIFSRNMPK